MNGESASTCLSASIQDLTGRATDSELAGNPRSVGSAGSPAPTHGNVLGVTDSHRHMCQECRYKRGFLK